MATLYIIRGLPGSGKSTIARDLLEQKPGANHFEADMYFIDRINDEYKFDAARIGDAHEWCQEHVAESLSNGNDTIVSNTTTRYFDLVVYLMIAKGCGAKVLILDCVDNYGSIHNVPEKVMDRMRAQWQPCSMLAAKIKADGFTDVEFL